MGTNEALCKYLEDETGLHVSIKKINSSFITLEFRNEVTNEYVMEFFLWRETVRKKNFVYIYSAVLYKLNTQTDYGRK